MWRCAVLLEHYGGLHLLNLRKQVLLSHIAVNYPRNDLFSKEKWTYHFIVHEGAPNVYFWTTTNVFTSAARVFSAHIRTL